MADRCPTCGQSCKINIIQADKLRKAGFKLQEIADIFGVTRQAVHVALKLHSRRESK